MDFRVVRDPLEGRLESGYRPGSPAIAHEAGPRAEAAIDAAAIGGHEEDSIRVASNQVRRDFVSLFTQRVAEVALRGDRLLGPRDALAPNWAIGVDRVTKCEIVRRDRDGQPGGHGAGGADSLRIREGEGFVESL